MCFGASVNLDYQHELADFFGVKLVEYHEIYLGLPTFGNKCKKDLFSFIKDRVWSKVKGSYNSSFSLAGYEVLIKAVVQAIPSHAMSVFKLPKKLVRDLHRLIARFWWGSI